LSEHSSDPVDGCVDVLMLPNPYDTPSRVPQRGVDALVAFSIGQELRNPVPTVAPGLSPVDRTAMPEASVDEDCELLAREEDVHTCPNIARDDTSILAESQST
jgi:hypothetical protein